jgi:hypothetical protein
MGCGISPVTSIDPVSHLQLRAFWAIIAEASFYASERLSRAVFNQKASHLQVMLHRKKEWSSAVKMLSKGWQQCPNT